MRKGELENVVARLKEAKVEAEIVEVDKNNGVKKVGIMLTGGDIRPIIYPDPDDTEDSVLEECLENIGIEIINQEALQNFLSMNYDSIKDHLRLRLTSNPAKGVIFEKAFCDLYKTVHIKLPTEVNCLGVDCGIQIKEDHLRHLNVTKEIIFEEALESTKQNEPIVCDLLDVYLKETYDLDLGVILPILTLTNKSRSYGASAILYASKLSENTIIIPSSVHELLLIPGIKGIDFRTLEITELIKEVNSKCVAPEDVLSDHAYIVKNGKIEIM